MCGGPQGTGQLQGPHPATHAPLGPAEHGRSGGQTAALPAGLEGLLRAGANAQGLAKAGRMAAPPIASDPAPAMEAAQDHLPGTQGTGASQEVAKQVAGNCHRWWRNGAMLLNSVLTIAYFDRLGVPRLS